jgi:hypothetical protein
MDEMKNETNPATGKGSQKERAQKGRNSFPKHRLRKSAPRWRVGLP